MHEQKNVNLKQFHTLIHNQFTATETFHFTREIIVAINIIIIKKNSCSKAHPGRVSSS